MAEIVIINPRFETSFWGLEHSIPLLGKRANLPVACLPLLAALAPKHHNVTLIDENVEAINMDAVAKADIVAITGMCVQRVRMKEILEELKARNVFTVVGGSFVTVEKNYFDHLADVVFLGEADETWPQFLQEWERGEHKNRYEQAAKTDMTKLPPPRLDLLKTDRYMYGSMQISRGCPFQCEFCDIIVTFGRRPRLKTSEQVIKELDTFLENNLRLIFVVDDNLIGNKKEIKPVLREIIKWQQAHGYPLTFFTEASLDLAEDDELMQLMAEAYFQSVFVGIESPNEESLKETKKYQNVRPTAGSIMDRIHRIQDNGIDVWCGMILGFDHDDPSAFKLMPQFLQESRIAHALIGLLHAIPTTPLYARLKEEGRLDESEDFMEFGTNVLPLQMGREELRNGYVGVMKEVYEVDSYFQRLEDLFIRDNFKHPFHSLPYWRKHRLLFLKRCALNVGRVIYIYQRLMRDIPEKHLRNEYSRRFWRLVKARPFEPHIWFIYIIKITMHYHYYTMVQGMVAGRKELVRSW